MSRSSADGIIRQRYLEEIIRKERDSMVGRYLVRRRRKREGEGKDDGAEEEDERADDTKSRQFEVFRKRLEMQRLQPSAAQLRMRQKLLEKHEKPLDKHEELLEKHEKPTVASPSECTGTNKDDTAPQRPVFRLPPLEMRPVDDKIKTQLYGGGGGGPGREGGGRRSYLRTRNGLGPDQKYRYPVLTSWDYGWKVAEVVKTDELRSPPFGRTRIVSDTFYSRNGVLDSLELSYSVS